MLHSAEILKSPLPTKPPVKQSLARRDVSRSFSLKNSYFLADFMSPTLTTARNNTKTVMSKVKRSIADIFTPYSVTSNGDTANANYRKMNSNFRTIHVSESKLAHAQSTLSDNFFQTPRTWSWFAEKGDFLRASNTQGISFKQFPLWSSTNSRNKSSWQSISNCFFPASDIWVLPK